MLTFHAVGEWRRGHVRAQWVDRSSRRVVPEVERLIDDAWQRILAQAGVHLFDGPMCRIERFSATDETLTLTLSPTSYKPFLGTNLHNPQLAKEFGRDVMANPVGVSTLVETADGFLLLGRRNASVAYYPDRTHPFAGALEPRDGADPFAAVYRELEEELRLSSAELREVRCTGMVEDAALMQPELIFAARASLLRGELERRMDQVEHHAVVAIRAERGDVERWLKDASLTPVAVASLLLWGRLAWGEAWFTNLRVQFVA